MNRKNLFSRDGWALVAGLGLFVFGALEARANNLYGTYDFEGKATISVDSSALPFGLGNVDLGNNVDASGVVKLQKDKVIVQLETPIRRREVITLNRKLRAPNRKSFRFRESGKTTFRGNEINYRVALRLKRKDGKWEGRGKAITSVTSGDLAGSRANVRGRIEQR